MSPSIAFSVLLEFVAAIGAMAAAIDGTDVQTFTGGVGEHSATVREQVAGRLRHLGIVIDRRA